MCILEPIRVRSHGRGPGPVHVLHGGPGAPGCALGLARALADQFRVHEPLQRLSGEVPLTVAQHVEDLAAVVETPMVLVGHSWGAMLALSFATVHPDLTRALALVGCGTYDTSTRAQYKAEMDARLRSLDAPREQESFAERAVRSIRAQAHDPLDLPDDLGVVDEQANRETWADVLARQAEGIEPAAFAAIRCPVTMFHGAQDPHPGPETAQLLRRYLPQLRYRSYERCGHEPWRERHARAAFLRDLRAEIAGHLGGAPRAASGGVAEGRDPP